MINKLLKVVSIVVIMLIAGYCIRKILLNQRILDSSHSDLQKMEHELDQVWMNIDSTEVIVEELVD